MYEKTVSFLTRVARPVAMQYDFHVHIRSFVSVGSKRCPLRRSRREVSKASSIFTCVENFNLDIIDALVVVIDSESISTIFAII